MFVTASFDGRIRLWDNSSKLCRRTFTLTSTNGTDDMDSDTDSDSEWIIIFIRVKLVFHVEKVRLSCISNAKVEKLPIINRFPILDKYLTKNKLGVICI